MLGRPPQNALLLSAVTRTPSLQRNACLAVYRRGFTTTAGQFPERYFLVEYAYVQDAYYKRIPVRDEHLAALETLKTKASAKLITAPLFPYSGGVFFIASQAEDPHAEVTKFVKDDPYVKAELVESYKIREFALTDKQTEFDRIAAKFLLRS